MAGAVKVKLSSSAEAKRSRIRRLPKFLEETVRATLKRDATMLVKTFQDGIRENDLGLDRLADSSVASKISKGYTKPFTPLYGAGDDEPRSYINMLKMRKLKNGWLIYVSNARHHDSSLKLKDLFIVHEFGATIQMEHSIVRIPPRPAFTESFTKMLKSKRRAEPERQVKQAMTEWINTAQSQTKRRIIRRQNEFMTRGLQEI
jgi:hypothetical protein